MNALTTIDIAAPQTERFTVFSPQRQAEFLQSLQLSGNVRLAARAARVSAQTAYRARRGSAAFARAWDSALLAARDHAEQVLADRALNGWEEAVFYHGEEVARRRRYSDRLLLAHLARLDRLEARPDIAAGLATLDAAINSLSRGEALAEPVSPQDRVPPVPSRREAGRAILSSSNTAASEEDDGDAAEWIEREDENGEGVLIDPLDDQFSEGSWARRIPPAGYPEWEADMDDPAHWENGEYIPPLGRTLREMDAKRPRGASQPWQLGRDAEACQLTAFEAGVPEWWQIANEDELYAALDDLEG
ncbi:hypothetical protein E3U23_04380 [Erythrobacter litoralis]|uniref:hypothetical protein n=1 Tax=Erythrobacter litoralis TaxID=39960 RepID=UPI0024356186|nr:hypothetical protein [Erythrobacter litoralis]MDG6078427.1 hypothetical protein [Erythrobacter litoralis]